VVRQPSGNASSQKGRIDARLAPLKERGIPVIGKKLIVVLGKAFSTLILKTAKSRNKQRSK
jgi:hypothetical protein